MIRVNHSLIPGVLIITEQPVDDDTYYQLDRQFGSAKHVIHLNNTDKDPERYVEGVNGLLNHLGLHACNTSEERNIAIKNLLQLPHWLVLNL